jgi:hypothetical protein
VTQVTAAPFEKGNRGNSMCALTEGIAFEQVAGDQSEQIWNCFCDTNLKTSRAAGTCLQHLCFGGKQAEL